MKLIIEVESSRATSILYFHRISALFKKKRKNEETFHDDQTPSESDPSHDFPHPTSSGARRAKNRSLLGLPEGNHVGPA